MSKEVAIQAESISKHFGGVQALTDVSFGAGPASIVGLIGPNGSGKSTLFNVLSGFTRPDKGRVLWNGEDITTVPRYRRPRLGLVRTFQERMAFDELTTRENLAFARIQHRLPDISNSALAEQVEYVGLPAHVLDQRARDLSWGQIRLLGIALTLAIEPRILLLDEPFAGLNRIAAQDVTRTLRRLRDDGMGLVVVEHEMDLLLPLCDRVVAFNAGRKVAEGTSSEILRNPDVRAAYFGDT